MTLPIAFEFPAQFYLGPVTILLLVMVREIVLFQDTVDHFAYYAILASMTWTNASHMATKLVTMLSEYLSITPSFRTALCAVYFTTAQCRVVELGVYGLNEDVVCEFFHRPRVAILETNFMP